MWVQLNVALVKLQAICDDPNKTPAQKVADLKALILIYRGL